MKATLAILALLIVIALGAGAYYYFGNHPLPGTHPADDSGQTATTTGSAPVENPDSSVIGTSVGGRDITAYHYGTGATEVLFVGGIHGGYEANTSLVAFDLMDYLEAHPEAVPSNERVTVLPVVNPDGLELVVGTSGRFDASAIPADLAATVPGRFNANDVDLNRNFECDWQPTGTWQSTEVSGGTAAFSEPESQAVRDYINAHRPAAVVVWYSSAGGVYSSNCHAGVSSETAALTELFADASGYPAHQEFDFYEITGDMTNWLAKNGIPAISVLLTNHTDAEWDKNRAGIDAILAHYAN